MAASGILSDGVPDGDGPPRLLAVTIDHLSAWMLPAYGATWVAARCLDAIAGEGVVFDRVLAPSVSARVAREALLPFLAPTTGPPLLPPGGFAECEDWTEAVGLVRDGRHRVVACHVPGLGRSWEADAELRQRYRDEEDLPAMEGTAVPGFATDAGSDPDVLNMVRQAYAAEITLLDLKLARLADAVRESAGRWTMLVAGTSGMPLGLHGQVGPEPVEPDCVPPYGERVHLPVIVRDHAGRMAGQRFSGLLAAADIGAAVSEWFCGSGPPASGERRVASFFETGRVVPREIVRVQGVASAAVATADWHLVAFERGNAEEPGVRLFSKPDDFFEVNDVADRCPEDAASLLEILRE